MLAHCASHRRVTRRGIEAFPDDKLFTYAIRGMRPFAALVMEMIGMGGLGIKGIVTGKWEHYNEAAAPATKQELLPLVGWCHRRNQQAVGVDSCGTFPEVEAAFGQWEGTIHSTLFYFIDNEIHHRGQGYVYLRSLGIEPPAFWDRQ